MARQAGETYLGDAIYVSVRRGMLSLRCEAPSEPNVMYFEPETLAALFRFVDSVNRGEIQEF